MRRAAAAVAVLALATAACSATGSGNGADTGSDGDRTLTVMAAASLTEPFGALAKTFEADHPGVDVRTSFDSSATIATQVVNGAPADVVATADERTMQVMADQDALAGDPVVFAHNVLTLVVPPANPAGISRLQDLDGSDYVVCASAVPCGALAETLLADAGVTTEPRSHEVDVKAVLTKVVLDEADAGLVYASDVVAAGDQVREVPVPGAPGTDYPVAVTADSADPELAQQFLDLVLSEQGRQALDAAGFEASGAPR